MSREALIAVLLAGSYVFGSIPFGVLIGRLRGVDPRTVGSKNIGMTNVWRSLGPGPALLVFILDVAKGFLPVWIARHAGYEVSAGQGALRYWESLEPVWVVLAGSAAIVGHNWPVFLKFKGGKGISTSLGVLYALDWRIATGDWLLFFVVLAIWRYVSLSSMVSAFTLPFWCWYFTRGTPSVVPVTTFGAIIGAFVLYKHRANFGRLLAGTEPKIGQRKGK